MSENELTLVKISTGLSVQHQLGKLIFGTIVGFAATKGAEKLYDVALDVYRHKTAIKK